MFLLFSILSKNKTTAIKIVAFILLPGTIVHEIAHMLVAEVLRVPTGEFSFVPEILENQQVKAGSLKIAKTDPFRRAIIGLAPVTIGLGVILAITHIFFLPLSNHLISQSFRNITFSQIISLLIIFYALFFISNTLFSSKEDLKTLVFPIILFYLFFSLLWFAGISIKVSFSPKFIDFFKNFLQKTNIGIGSAIIVNVLVLSFIKILLYILESLFKFKQKPEDQLSLKEQ